MFLHKSLHINDSIRSALAKIGLSEFKDFVNYSAGELLSRPSKRPVRSLYLDVAGQKRKYFLKQAGFKWHCSETARELLILELFRDHGIPVMTPVAWGESKVFGWSISGFILVEEVVGREFVEVYRDASLRNRRRLMWVHGELMGTLHQKGIGSKVHPRDLICISEDYETFRKCLVVIDRERGLTRLETISLEQRGKTLAEIWIKGAFTIGRGKRTELLAFLSGYVAASCMYQFNKAIRRDLGNEVVTRAVGILENDRRFSSLRQDFKEKYGIPREARKVDNEGLR